MTPNFNFCLEQITGNMAEKWFFFGFSMLLILHLSKPINNEHS
jgi:hypothetical protein